jgi:hypothetical protein
MLNLLSTGTTLPLPYLHKNPAKTKVYGSKVVIADNLNEEGKEKDKAELDIKVFLLGKHVQRITFVCRSYFEINQCSEM